MLSQIKYNDTDYLLFIILFALCAKNAFMGIWALPRNYSSLDMKLSAYLHMPLWHIIRTTLPLPYQQCIRRQKTEYNITRMVSIHFFFQNDFSSVESS
jgi:hypothetical protein